MKLKYRTIRRGWKFIPQRKWFIFWIPVFTKQVPDDEDNFGFIYGVSRWKAFFAETDHDDIWKRKPKTIRATGTDQRAADMYIRKDCERRQEAYDRKRYKEKLEYSLKEGKKL